MQDIEKLIDRLEKLSNWFSEQTHSYDMIQNLFHKESAEIVTSAISTINELYEKQKWRIVADGDLPEDLQEVIITFLNHEPEEYYKNIKDKPMNGCAVYYDEKWYWYTPTTRDMLAEYGHRFESALLDDALEVIAWMPLPDPFKKEV